MENIISQASDLANLVLTVTVIAGAIIGALQASRWGKSKAVQTAANIAEIIRDAATVAVNATEQVYRKVPAPVGGAEVAGRRAEKLDAARHKLLEILPAGIAASPEEADAAIQAAVHKMNETRAR